MYTILMRRLCLLAAGFIALWLMSVLSPAAFAYMGPEEVIFSEEFLLPPKPRETRARVDAQNDTSTATREAIYADMAETLARQKAKGQASSNTSEETDPELQALIGKLAQIFGELNEGSLHPSAPEKAAVELSAHEEDRLLQRIRERQLQNRAPWSGEVLRSGAPLVDSGSGTVVAIIGLALAGIWTLKRATKKGYIKVEMS